VVCGLCLAVGGLVGWLVAWCLVVDGSLAGGWWLVVGGWLVAGWAGVGCLVGWCLVGSLVGCLLACSLA
jgi:uncharacterized membrane protein